MPSFADYITINNDTERMQKEQKKTKKINTNENQISDSQITSSV